ncbi:MAG: hypothetical protein KatS3mg004_0725 [Bryobacteraceae bacterium]|nr:MAG: hypothetical protein KatS3mg004_0725 [Bryobacteraceae bacterium]
MKRFFFAAAFAGLLLLAFWGWRWHSERLLRERVWRIGWEDDPPNMFTGPDGRPSGFGPELVNQAAKRRGIRLERSANRMSISPPRT